MPFATRSLLPTILLADAVLSGLAGALMVGGGSLIGPHLGLPAPLLVAAGGILLAYAAVVGWLSRRAVVPRPVLLALVGINLLWGAECLLLPALGWVEPSALGWGFLLAQTAFVVVIADLVWFASRPMRTVAAE